MNEIPSSIPVAGGSAIPTALPSTSAVTALLPLIPGVPALNEEQWRETLVRLQDLRVEGEKFVRSNPGRSILYAMGAGFLLGLLLRR
ncbi:MAG: hypothetical protein ACR2OZ_07805 [Verrucomicrobiales bacterium]